MELYARNWLSVAVIPWYWGCSSVLRVNSFWIEDSVRTGGGFFDWLVVIPFTTCQEENRLISRRADFGPPFFVTDVSVQW